MTIGRIPSVEGGIQPTIVDAKGDLIAGVAADSINRLAVGSNDQVLVADSSASTGLAWKSVATPFAAGKNKIINGDFGIWQRGTSLTNSGSFIADRFDSSYDGSGNTTVVSQQIFTPGSAPVAGYESQYFYRFNRTVAGTGNTVAYPIRQRIEDVRTLAGQTVTVSFWAKADSNRTITVYLQQLFGSGGSGAVTTTMGTAALTTSWQRFSLTGALPSVSGKTIGSGSSLQLTTEFIHGNITYTFDFWGIQVEAGNVATPFQTATGTLQGELAACQRYYVKLGGNTAFENIGNGSASSTTRAVISIPLPVTQRSTNQSLTGGNLTLSDGVNTTAVTAIAFSSQGLSCVRLNVDVASGLTQYRPYFLYANNTTAMFIGVEAEL